MRVCVWCLCICVSVCFVCVKMLPSLVVPDRVWDIVRRHFKIVLWLAFGIGWLLVTIFGIQQHAYSSQFTEVFLHINSTQPVQMAYDLSWEAEVTVQALDSDVILCDAWPAFNDPSKTNVVRFLATHYPQNTNQNVPWNSGTKQCGYATGAPNQRLLVAGILMVILSMMILTAKYFLCGYEGVCCFDWCIKCTDVCHLWKCVCIGTCGRRCYTKGDTDDCNAQCSNCCDQCGDECSSPPEINCKSNACCCMCQKETRENCCGWWFGSSMINVRGIRRNHDAFPARSQHHIASRV